MKSEYDLKDNKAKIIRFEIAPSTILTIAVVVTAFWLLSFLLPVILILVTSLILVGALVPAVKWLEHKRIKRGWSIAVVFILLTLITVFFISLTIPQIIEQVQNLIEHEPETRSKIVKLFEKSRVTSPLADYLRNFKYDLLIKSSAGTAFEFSAYVFELFAYSLGVIFLSLYIMIDRDRLQGGLFAVIPRSHHIRFSRVMLNLETIVGGYIRGQALTCALLSTFIFILLWSFNIPNALSLALFGGLADVLPYIGIFLTMFPVVLAALSKGTVVTIIVFTLMFIYEEFEGRILIPVIYGRALRLPSSIILISLFIGTALLGIIGALLALPVAAAIRMLIIELRVDLPGETEKKEDTEIKKKDAQIEKEYELRTEGMTATESAAIAIEISDERKREEESHPQNKENEKKEL